MEKNTTLCGPDKKGPLMNFPPRHTKISEKSGVLAIAVVRGGPLRGVRGHLVHLPVLCNSLCCASSCIVHLPVLCISLCCACPKIQFSHFRAFSIFTSTPRSMNPTSDEIFGRKYCRLKTYFSDQKKPRPGERHPPFASLTSDTSPPFASLARDTPPVLRLARLVRLARGEVSAFATISRRPAQLGSAAT